MPAPKDPKLYEKASKIIKTIYKKNSAYRSGAIVKCYKLLYAKKYGMYSIPYVNDHRSKKLKRWFDEKWIDVNELIGKKKMGNYPLYRPTKRISKDTPTLFQEIPKRNIIQQFELKQKYKGSKNLPPFQNLSKK